MKKISLLLVAVVMFLGIASSAHATLFLRGTDSLLNQLIYDDDLNITWYDYSQSWDTWQNQMNWAGNLTVTFGGTDYNDWRLPTALNQDGTGPCEWYDICTGSEMGHLYFTELGNIKYAPQLSTSFTDGRTGNLEYFRNLQDSYYWSGTEYESSNPFANGAWFFIFSLGQQDFGAYNLDRIFALAVRSGDVFVAGVPEPATLLLFGAGLAGLGIMRKRFKG